MKQMSKAEREARILAAHERIAENLAGLVECFRELVEQAKKEHQEQKQKRDKR